MVEKIKLGLPKGSLNTVGRGNTCQLFLDAGYDIRGYEPGNEQEHLLRIENDPEIEVFLTRPQSAPIELVEGLLDIAIIGQDWVREEGGNVPCIGDLCYGKTRLVAALSRNSQYESLYDFFYAQRNSKTPIICFTEYVNLTRNHFMKNEGYRSVYGNKSPVIRVRGIEDGENKQVRIFNSDGVTESYIAKGADIIVDNTQTGSALKRNGLRILDEIMESSAGLFARPNIDDDKMKKAEEIFDFLKGVVDGKNYFDVKFNVGNENLQSICDYLTKERLCADEPTFAQGRNYSQVNIFIPRARYPAVISVLRKKYKIKSIVRNEVKQYIA